MSNETQANQTAQISTVLGADKLLLEKFTARERLSHPFEVVAEVLAVEGETDFTPHLGSGVSIAVNDGRELVDRSFHGVLFEAEAIGGQQTYVRYRLVLRPWLHLLKFGRKSRIFQKMSVKDIINQVFKDAGFSDFALNMTTAGLESREYCVQFRESDFDFISRLMEEEGIYYYFAHDDSSHKFVACDAPSCHPPAVGDAVEVLRGTARPHAPPHLKAWGRRVRPAEIKATLRDSHFRRPTQTLEATKAASPANNGEAAEYYDYPGGHGYHQDDGARAGTRYAETRLQELRADRESFFGVGENFAIATGDRLTIGGEAPPAEYLVVEARHSFGVQVYSGSEQTVPAHGVVEIETVPADLVWRPARITPKPIAGGPQTAVVVGKAGEVIDVDEYGRVHVQFPWDREGKNNEQSSCWVRVSQGWADGKFGMMMIPRIGEEVIVDFLDGDPDRPIITGRVYNADLMPPYALPADKTKSTWKSQTVGDAGAYEEAEEPPAGSDKGFNEIRFEDKGGSEEVFIHAQRLLNMWVRLDEARKTGRDVAVRVGRNRETTVKKNETFTLEEGDEKRTLKAGSRTTEIQKADTLTVKTGDYSLDVKAGQATVEAAQKITLKVGQNSIVISPSGIEIHGMTVKVKADTSCAVEGLTTDVKASTNLTVQGLLVSIN